VVGAPLSTNEVGMKSLRSGLTLRKTKNMTPARKKGSVQNYIDFAVRARPPFVPSPTLDVITASEPCRPRSTRGDDSQALLLA
jgi:hypothetical protein